jgi:hypothetical protein
MDMMNDSVDPNEISKLEEADMSAVIPTVTVGVDKSDAGVLGSPGTGLMLQLSDTTVTSNLLAVGNSFTPAAVAYDENGVVDFSAGEAMGHASKIRLSALPADVSMRASRNMLERHQQQNKPGKTFVEDPQKGALTRLVHSTAFSMLIMTTILTNSTFIFVEEEYRNASNDSDPVWIVSDVVFNVIFLLECVLKLLDMKHRYFFSTWNLFDFMLVALGLMGMVLNFFVDDEAQSGTNFYILRIARVFRVLRLVRMARLLKFVSMLRASLVKEEISAEVKEHIEKMTILLCFMRAHVHAQANLLKYFGGTTNKVSTVEVARCILQSEIAVHRVIFRAVHEEQSLEPQLLEELRQVRRSRKIAGELEHFILDAHNAGIIGAAEATSIVHPLHDYIKECHERIHAAIGNMPDGEIRMSMPTHLQREQSPKAEPNRGSSPTLLLVPKPDPAGGAGAPKPVVPSITVPVPGSTVPVPDGTPTSLPGAVALE